MPTTVPRALLFDLDGTLVDSLPGIARAYHVVLQALDLGDRSDAAISEFIGPPIQEVLRDVFGLEGEELEEGVRIFRAEYGQHGLLDFTKYPEIDTMLSRLTEAGFLLYIATSKLRSMATTVIEGAGWSGLFREIGGAEADGSRFLKADIIEWVMARVPADTEVRAMIGDRAPDMSGGRALGLPTIGVTWGYGSDDELRHAGAAELVHSPAELLKAVGVT
jgi:phosphoglycolate phosphatase